MAKTKNPELERERRQQIMLCCRRLLVAGSHRQLTLDAVAKEAGVSKGMLTYYFSSKDELLASTIEHFLSLQEVALGMIVADESRPVDERLRSLLEVGLPSREQVTDDVRFLVEVWSYAKDHPDTLETLRDTYGRFRNACLDLLRRGAEQGHVHAPDLAFVNVLLHALLDGLAFQLVLDPELDVASLRARVIALVESLLGVTP
ncbi:MAG: TetR/AcrR family transcriptional regulator [Myxococcales bacterium]|nr:TetR/AcrR family transcriptional regulator [Myxococcales bacterium]